MIPTDKWWHLTTSFAGVVAVVVILRLATQYGVLRLSYHRRIQVAVLVIFFLGLVKELGDGWVWTWPWCPCRSETHDLLANCFGIGLAAIGIVQLKWILNALEKKSPREGPAAVPRPVTNSLSEQQPAQEQSDDNDDDNAAAADDDKV